MHSDHLPEVPASTDATRTLTVATRLPERSAETTSDITTLPRKRLKQLPAPETYNLHQIEAWASHVGNEVHFDQRRIIVTRKIAEYVPCPCRSRSVAGDVSR